MDGLPKEKSYTFSLPYLAAIILPSSNIARIAELFFTSPLILSDIIGICLPFNTFSLISKSDFVIIEIPFYYDTTKNTGFQVEIGLKMDENSI